MHALLKLFYSILILPWWAYLNLALWAARKKFAKKQTEIEIIGTEVPSTMPLSKMATNQQELDFIKHRSPTYVRSMTWGIADEFAQMTLGTNKIKPFDEKVIVDIFTKSASSNMVEYDPKLKQYVADFSSFHMDMFPGYKLEIKRFIFDLDGQNCKIENAYGSTIQPHDPYWLTATLHVMSAITIAVPSATHNWVHFSFPDTLAALTDITLDKGTNLYKLLSVHTRFTNRINHQAIYTQKVTANKNNFIRHVIPWKALPLSSPKFRAGIIKNLEKRYTNLENHFGSVKRLDTNIPYFYFLKNYYGVVSTFVTRLALHLEAEDYAKLIKQAEIHLPGISKYPMIEVLTMLIWQVAVYHVSDHLSYVKYAIPHGFTERTQPLSEKLKFDNIKRYDRYKTRVFINVFVNFNVAANLDQRTENIDAYGFDTSSPCYKVAVQFRDELQALDQQLRSEGKQIVPLADMVQSVCF